MFQTDRNFNTKFRGIGGFHAADARVGVTFAVAWEARLLRHKRASPRPLLSIIKIRPESGQQLMTFAVPDG